MKKLLISVALIFLSLTINAESSFGKNITLPKSQLQFIKVIEESKLIKLKNDLQEDALLDDRTNALWNIFKSNGFNLDIKNWIGSVVSIKSDKKGNGIIKIAIGGETINSDGVSFYISNEENDLSLFGPENDIFVWIDEFTTPDRLIKKGSKLYKIIINLSQNDIVKFSGEFIQHIDGSFEKEDRIKFFLIREPNYIFEFTNIEKIKEKEDQIEEKIKEKEDQIEEKIKEKDNYDTQRIFYDNGQKKSEKNLKNGKLDGQSLYWHSNGQMFTKWNFLEDREDGKFTKWDQNGKLISQGNYKEGKKDGKWISWYENGNTKLEQNFSNGKLFGKSIEWHENGQKEAEGYFNTPEKDGYWITWYSSGQKKTQGNYKEGKKDGKWIEWYLNGQKKKEWNYKNGKLNGNAYRWDTSGQLTIDVNYSNGKLTNRIIIDKHLNGKKKSQGNYKEGKKDGKWIEWYGNGEKKSQGKYKVGGKNGKWLFWTPSRKKSKRKYKNNQCISGDCPS